MALKHAQHRYALPVAILNLLSQIWLRIIPEPDLTQEIVKPAQGNLMRAFLLENKMLNGFEDVCPQCNGTKQIDSTTPCDYCRARGSIPNAQGIALLEFMNFHMFGQGQQFVREAVERRFADYLKTGR